MIEVVALMAVRNQALRDFLRARRGDVAPTSAGMPEGAQRRVPGLRREEVAMLAGVSVDYYIRLEQGRDVSPSDSVLDSIARVLQLRPEQRSQLYALVRGSTSDGAAVDDTVRPTALELLAALTIPALLVGRGTAVVGQNPLHRGLTTGFASLPSEQRFYAWWLFVDTTAKSLLEDWEHSARETVGVLRAAATRFPENRRLHALVQELTGSSADFRALWGEHDVESPSAGPKRYRHPEVGDLLLLHEVAQLSTEHWLHLYWAEPGSASERALNRLR